jgi:hypothetical protein
MVTWFGLLAALFPLSAIAQVKLVRPVSFAPQRTLILIDKTPQITGTPRLVEGDFKYVDHILNQAKDLATAKEAIRARAATLSWLGPARGDVRLNGIGCYFQEFAGGNLYAPLDSTHAFSITGDTLKLYLTLTNSQAYHLGQPNGDTLPLNDQRGWATEFRKGAIYWSPQTGAQEIKGENFKRWAALGREKSWLGYPVTGDLAAAGGDAQRVTSFEYGQLITKDGVITATSYRDIAFSRFKGLGGIKSPLGLPYDARFPVSRNAHGAFFNFRGGSVTVPYNAPVANPVAQTRVIVRFAGLECKVRQEKEDEMFGGVSAFVPSTLQTVPVPIADWRFKDRVRVWPDSRVLYDGPPTDIVLTTTLLEKDSGPLDWADRFISIIHQTSMDVLGEVGGTIGLDDVVNAFTREIGGLVGKFGGFLQGKVKSLLNILFGSADDKYPDGVISMKADSLRARAANKRTLRRTDDLRTIEYTDEVTVTAKDNGGDVGIYTFYFKVEVQDIQNNL